MEKTVLANASENETFVIVAWMIDLFVVQILIDIRADEEEVFAILLDLCSEPKVILRETSTRDDEN